MSERPVICLASAHSVPAGLIDQMGQHGTVVVQENLHQATPDTVMGLSVAVAASDLLIVATVEDGPHDTEMTVWNAAADLGIPRLCVVTCATEPPEDGQETDFSTFLDTAHDELSGVWVAAQLPVVNDDLVAVGTFDLVTSELRTADTSQQSELPHREATVDERRELLETIDFIAPDDVSVAVHDLVQRSEATPNGPTATGAVMFSVESMFRPGPAEPPVWQAPDPRHTSQARDAWNQRLFAVISDGVTSGALGVIIPWVAEVTQIPPVWVQRRPVYAFVRRDVDNQPVGAGAGIVLDSSPTGTLVRWIFPLAEQDQERETLFMTRPGESHDALVPFRSWLVSTLLWTSGQNPATDPPHVSKEFRDRSAHVSSAKSSSIGQVGDVSLPIVAKPGDCLATTQLWLIPEEWSH